MRLFALLFVAFLGLAGCGQKGPLYLPETPETNQPAQPIDQAPVQE